MFDLFKKKKSSGPKLTDRIWMRQEDKWKACLATAKTDPATIFIAWFDETREQLEELAAKENIPINVVTATPAGLAGIKGPSIIFAEHYPLQSREQSVYDQLSLPGILVFSALDEPLFKQFGSDKIIQMMKSLGMSETKPLENRMISDAIRNAQHKIEKNLSFEQTARSQAGWLAKNSAMK